MTTSPRPLTKNVWPPRVIGWLTLLCGFASGFILAAINWHQMGLRRKAVLHLLVGLVFAFPYAVIVRTYRAFSTFDYILQLVINLSVVFVVTAYLHTQTAKDIQQLQASGGHVVNVGTLPAVGIALLTALCFGWLTSQTATVCQPRNDKSADHRVKMGSFGILMIAT